MPRFATLISSDVGFRVVSRVPGFQVLRLFMRQGFGV